MTRDRMVGAATALLAVAGIALVAIGSDERGAAPSATADAVAEAHAAAGIEVSPQVAADFTRRIAELELSIESAPDDRAAVLELARLLHDGHRTREALPFYRRAIELAPDDPVPHYDLAAAHAELDEWAEARAVLLARVGAAPSDATALYDLGVAEINLGDEEAALDWWRRARAAAGADEALRARIDDALARVGGGPDPEPPRAR